MHIRITFIFLYLDRIRLNLSRILRQEQKKSFSFFQSDLNSYTTFPLIQSNIADLALRLSRNFLFGQNFTPKLFIIYVYA